MSRLKVSDPDDAQWRVWRRWYAWRRWVTLRDVGRATGEILGVGSATNTDPTGDDIFGCLVFLLFLPLVVIGLTASLVDLVGQLLVLPVVVLARILRLASWPVQLDRERKHFRTHRVKGFGAAAALRDALAEQIRNGSLPDRPRPDPATTAEASS